MITIVDYLRVLDGTKDRIDQAVEFRALCEILWKEFKEDVTKRCVRDIFTTLIAQVL